MVGDEPTVEKARIALAKAAADGCDYVVIESRRQRWLARAAEISVTQGWLEPGELVQLDYQSSELRYRLTPAGKRLR